MNSLTNYTPTYPKEAWRQLSPEDKLFMRELKKVFGNLKYEGETAPAGVIPFQTDRTGKRWIDA